VAGSEEPITSPDQRKPDHPKVFWTLTIIASLIFLALTLGNHRGNVENLWLIGLAVTGFLTVIIDWTLRRNGLR
jgi:tellurite resistance protein TehA-like permease